MDDGTACGQPGRQLLLDFAAAAGFAELLLELELDDTDPEVGEDVDELDELDDESADLAGVDSLAAAFFSPLSPESGFSPGELPEAPLRESVR